MFLSRCIFYKCWLLFLEYENILQPSPFVYGIHILLHTLLPLLYKSFETVQKAWGNIYAEWFPSSGYQQMEGPEILSIKSKDLQSPKVACESWIPVSKRGVATVNEIL
ncbi:GyrI-like domain-containing protein [Niallia sp. JL1B1071]|uniref:GyrI-like domain-containing protein n=1 Tax=Niallia tiangongensis TaxID=3237105 RepID=UPI0037DC5CAF